MRYLNAGIDPIAQVDHLEAVPINPGLWAVDADKAVIFDFHRRQDLFTAFQQAAVGDNPAHFDTTAHHPTNFFHLLKADGREIATDVKHLA
ncbi:hypothetical protein D3C73_1232440 [compost metagenome]